MVTQGSKVPFSKSYLLATFICKMVAIDNYLVAKKKLWYQWEYTSCCVIGSVIIQPIINRFFNFFFKSVSCQLATFTTILGSRVFHASYSTLLLKWDISVWAPCWIVWIWRLFSRRKCTFTAYAIILMWKCWEKTSYELNCTPSSQQFPSLSSLHL